MERNIYLAKAMSLTCCFTLRNSILFFTFLLTNSFICLDAMHQSSSRLNNPQKEESIFKKMKEKSGRFFKENKDALKKLAIVAVAVGIAVGGAVYAFNRSNKNKESELIPNPPQAEHAPKPIKQTETAPKQTEKLFETHVFGQPVKIPKTEYDAMEKRLKEKYRKQPKEFERKLQGYRRDYNEKRKIHYKNIRNAYDDFDKDLIRILLMNNIIREEEGKK